MNPQNGYWLKASIFYTNNVQSQTIIFIGNQ
jgi:hypothetical protein